jgi:hypothetical protein
MATQCAHVYLEYMALRIQNNYHNSIQELEDMVTKENKTLILLYYNYDPIHYNYEPGDMRIAMLFYLIDNDTMKKQIQENQEERCFIDCVLYDVSVSCTLNQKEQIESFISKYKVQHPSFPNRVLGES